MSIEIHRAVIDALGFDLASAVTAFQDARTAHAQTIGEPAPTAHPLVELITRSGGAFVIIEPPVVAPPELPPLSLTAYAADRRWRAEQAGTVWNGWPIHTDDRSQGKYLSELQAITLGVRIDGDPWKFADGAFRPVSNADFPALATAARAHVRGVFAIEGQLIAAIEAGTITDQAGVDAAFAAAPT
ncbi:DUF4376 domain-containing protein [Bosea sp. 2KB_26]|uniref:DUF4376 domain-containing protein n=1 Tax=Bosea sp. 2KB_26 TaxID=3237475 RepID=UPI003F8EF02F